MIQKYLDASHPRPVIHEMFVSTCARCMAKFIQQLSTVLYDFRKMLHKVQHGQ